MQGPPSVLALEQASVEAGVADELEEAGEEFGGGGALPLPAGTQRFMDGSQLNGAQHLPSKVQGPWRVFALLQALVGETLLVWCAVEHFLVEFDEVEATRLVTSVVFVGQTYEVMVTVEVVFTVTTLTAENPMRSRAKLARMAVW